MPTRGSRERLCVTLTTVRGDQHGASAMREQTSEIDITPLADPAEPPAHPARVFARCQPEPAGKLACPSKRVDVTDAADQRGRGQQADAGNRTKLRHDRIGIGEDT